MRCVKSLLQYNVCEIKFQMTGPMFTMLFVATTVRVFFIFNFRVLLCRVPWLWVSWASVHISSTVQGSKLFINENMYLDIWSLHKSVNFSIFSSLNSGSECALYGAPVMALTIFFCVIISFDIHVSSVDCHKIMPYVK